MLVSKLRRAFSVVLVLGLMATWATLQTSRTAVGQEAKKEQPNGPAVAKEPNVTVRFLGGDKKVPLADLNVTVRKHTGDWSDDHKKSMTAGKTDKDGNARFSLADGLYYIEITSDKALPYLNIPVGHKGYAGYYDRLIKVGKEQSFEFNLADACKLTLRAVDAASGQGIPGVSFSMESQTGESGGVVVGLHSPP